MSKFPNLGSNYNQNYVKSSWIYNFSKNNGLQRPNGPILIPNLDIANNTEYPINLTAVVNNNNSVTFSGYINQSNFVPTSVQANPYPVTFTFNNITGQISVTVNNYSNNNNIVIEIIGYTKFASTIHNITFYYNNIVL